MRRDLAAPKTLLKEILRITQEGQENDDLFRERRPFGHRPRSERYMVDKNRGQQKCYPHRQAVNNARPKWPSEEKAAQETYERLCTTQEKQK